MHTSHNITGGRSWANLLALLSLFIFFLGISVAAYSWDNHWFWTIDSPASSYESYNDYAAMPTDFDGRTVVAGGRGGFSITDTYSFTQRSYTISFTGQASTPVVQGIAVKGQDVYVSGYFPTDTADKGFIVRLDASSDPPSVVWARSYAVESVEAERITSIRLLEWQDRLVIMGLADAGKRYLLIIDAETGEPLYAIPVNGAPFYYTPVTITGGIDVDSYGNIYVADGEVIVKIVYDASRDPPFSSIKGIRVSYQEFFDLDVDPTSSYLVAAGFTYPGHNGNPSDYRTPWIVLISTDVSEVKWGRILYTTSMSYDYYSYGVAIYPGRELGDTADDIIFWVGAMEFETSTYNHPFIVYLDTEGNIVLVYEIPGAVDAKYTRGVYYSVYDAGGVALAIGNTWYAASDTTYYGLGIALFSQAINDTLSWQEGAPADWPPVYAINRASVAEFAEASPEAEIGSAAASILTDIAVADLEADISPYEGTWSYVARDDNIPEPIPEPWLLSVAALFATVVVVFLARRRVQEDTSR